MQVNLWICLQAIVPRPTVIVTTCSSILTLELRSRVRCNAGDVACLCYIMFALKRVVHSSAVMQTLWMRVILPLLCNVMMGSRYETSSVSYRLSFSIQSPFLLNVSFIGCVTAPSGFLQADMSGRYLQDGIPLNCLQFLCRIVQSITSRIGLVARAITVSTTLHSKASSPFIMFQVYLKSPFFLRSVFASCDSRTLWKPACIIFRAGLHLFQYVTSGDSHVLHFRKVIRVPIPSRLRGHIEQYNVNELQRGRGFGLCFGLFAWSCSLAID